MEDWGKVISHCALICISLMMRDVEHFSMGLLTNLYIFFKEMPLRVLCPFLNQFVYFVVEL